MTTTPEKENHAMKTYKLHAFADNSVMQLDKGAIYVSTDASLDEGDAIIQTIFSPTLGSSGTEYFMQLNADEATLLQALTEIGMDDPENVAVALGCEIEEARDIAGSLHNRLSRVLGYMPAWEIRDIRTNELLMIVNADSDKKALDAYSIRLGFAPYDDHILSPEEEYNDDNDDRIHPYRLPDGTIGAVFTNYEITATRAGTPIRQNLTTEDLDRMLDDDRHLGFGYACARHLPLSTRIPLDRNVVEVANDLGLSYDDLFEWSNSKYGRHLTDAASDAYASKTMVGQYLNVEALQVLTAGG